MKITLLRHTEVESEFLACYNGHNDISLSQTGQDNAQILAIHFQNSDFDAVFCSDLTRCKQTLAPILKQHHKPLQCTYTQALREKSWGRHEGMSFDAIISSETFKYENFLQWIHALDGEPYDAYMARLHHFFTQELAQTPYNHLLVVTHAGVIRILMHLFENISLQTAFSKPFPYGSYITLDAKSWHFGVPQCVS